MSPNPKHLRPVQPDPELANLGSCPFAGCGLAAGHHPSFHGTLVPRPRAVPVARLRALVRLLGPSELTPTAKRMIVALCREYE